jgi:hypothetical protein
MSTYFVDTNGNKYPMATAPAQVYEVLDSPTGVKGIFGTTAEAVSFMRNFLTPNDPGAVAISCTFAQRIGSTNSLGGQWDLHAVGQVYTSQLPLTLYLLTVNNVAKAVFPSQDLANQGANEYAGQGTLIVHRGALENL